MPTLCFALQHVIGEQPAHAILSLLNKMCYIAAISPVTGFCDATKGSFHPLHQGSYPPVLQLGPGFTCALDTGFADQPRPVHSSILFCHASPPQPGLLPWHFWLLPTSLCTAYKRISVAPQCTKQQASRSKQHKCTRWRFIPHGIIQVTTPHTKKDKRKMRRCQF